MKHRTAWIGLDVLAAVVVKRETRACIPVHFDCFSVACTCSVIPRLFTCLYFVRMMPEWREIIIPIIPPPGIDEYYMIRNLRIISIHMKLCATNSAITFSWKLLSLSWYYCMDMHHVSLPLPAQTLLRFSRFFIVSQSDSLVVSTGTCTLEPLEQYAETRLGESKSYIQVNLIVHQATKESHTYNPLR